MKVENHWLKRDSSKVIEYRPVPALLVLDSARLSHPAVLRQRNFFFFFLNYTLNKYLKDLIKKDQNPKKDLIIFSSINN